MTSKFKSEFKFKRGVLELELELELGLWPL